MKESLPADISVIIVSWNVREQLARCLSSLDRQQGVRAEVFVVDNASVDQSAEMVRSRFRSVRVIANTVNRGFATACNQALRVASGGVLLLLNPDTELSDHLTLRSTVGYLSRHKDVGILGVKIVNDNGTVQRSVQAFPGLASQALVLLKLHVLFPSLGPLRAYNAREFDYEHDADVDQVKGAFFAMPRRTLQNIGMFDERFFVWFEEVDYCKRARDAGLLVRFTPSIVVKHTGGASFRQLSSFEQQKIFNRSLLLYFKKHAGWAERLLLRVLTVPSMFLALLEPFFKPQHHGVHR
ncbi:MAG: glycosyltransferase family 2 protein [Candidatus Kerfeldbacteria bacterium]|nr:glycosyltransferase family 2 protein [Candidatus Kerfeldbacteria bacterium]